MSEDTVLLLSVRADHGGGPEHMFTLLCGLKGRRNFWVAAPAGQAYSERFANHSHFVPLPFRRFSIPALFRLIRLVRRENITLIHSHGKGAGVYGRLLGLATRRPVVHTFHGFHYRHLGALKRFVYLTLERWLASCTAVLLNVSASEQESCVSAGVIGRAGSVVIPNGVTVPPCQRDRSAIFSGSKPVLISVARHSPEKGVDGVLRIAERLSEIGQEYELWLVGDGEQRAELQAQAHLAGIEGNVRFLGFRDDVAELLQQADMFVSASHGEGMPLTLLEAMAAGLPVVASDVVGNRDVVEGGKTGFLFALDAPQQGAIAIEKLLSDEQLYGEYSRRSYQLARERYSAEVMCKRINEVYRQVTAKTRIGKT